MFLAYTAVAFFMFMMLMFAWSSKGFMNVVIKTALASMAFWSAYLLIVQLAQNFPTIKIV
jgi:hypothetical protein